MASITNTDVDKLTSFGKMALEQGWYDQAREYLEQALELDASNLEAMKGLARANGILSRRASFEPIKPEAPPAKAASKVLAVAEWVRKKCRVFAEWLRKKRRAYAEWLRKKQRERAERAAERKRLAAERRRYEAILDRIRWREAEEWKPEEWYLAGVDGYGVESDTDELLDAIVHGGLLLDDDDIDDFF